jgi:hypothetical protein
MSHPPVILYQTSTAALAATEARAWPIQTMLEARAFQAILPRSLPLAIELGRA